MSGYGDPNEQPGQGPRGGDPGHAGGGHGQSDRGSDAGQQGHPAGQAGYGTPDAGQGYPAGQPGYGQPGVGPPTYGEQRWDQPGRGQQGWEPQNHGQQGWQQPVYGQQNSGQWPAQPPGQYGPQQGYAGGYPAYQQQYFPGSGTSDYPVQVTVQRPEHSSRLLALFSIPYFLLRGLLLIPSLLCLYVLGICAGVVAWIGFWAVLFTGRYPEGMHEFVTGVLRWQTRTSAYLYGLIDAYPPFRLGN